MELQKIVEEIWDKQVQTKNYKPIIIEGTPGIGKTFFMIYMLYVCRNKGIDVAFSTLNVCYILDSWMPRKVIQTTFNDYLFSNESCIYLYDPNQVNEGTGNPNISVFRGRTLITTSQDDRTLSQLRDHPKEYFYMPIWTLDELKICRSLCYPNMLEQKVIDGFHLWGGSARHVFWSGDSDEIQKRLSAATTNYSTMESIVAKMESKFTDKYPRRRHQWLWHMVVDETYCKLSVALYIYTK